jgi:FixJ family two-component response regulator
MQSIPGRPTPRYDGVSGGLAHYHAVERLLVALVDDDESVRESLPDLVRELGFAARAFSSAEQFLASDCVSQTKCLILDIFMPGITGPELQRELKRRGQHIPIILIPFSDTGLLEALNAALRVG